ncbi:aminoacyl-tRNA hydrolase [Olegusella massiliensis]|uniref:aminoacyl-tRNA hydrolase n=1 Tax=Olegusella massiliensis TaxID=1776381 RepID=UPI0003AD8779|nr:aminoacyl-tRNA hydrolase [Olegusella massiliensis]ERL11421.1 aminoacyl-tRNA hydrolase [Coriobacteriaceae bacterium BV3Ac1]MBS5865251.1 aminoacyl-tRNA hydrolase [Coriobacteriaceae bacterium]
MATEESLSSYKSKQLIVMRRDLKMRKGKIAAQAGHACVEAVLMALARENRLQDVYLNVDETETPCWADLDDAGEPSALTDWFRFGVAKVCVYVDSEEELLEIAHQGREQGFLVSLIRDAGLTEFHGEATYTCLAFEPLRASDIDPITGALPLY